MSTLPFAIGPKPYSEKKPLAQHHHLIFVLHGTPHHNFSKGYLEEIENKSMSRTGISQGLLNRTHSHQR
jgi:hypothetical protein